jgi:hypothetical protein
MRKGADCLSKWVGEAERQLRLLFEQAQKMQPSIIFFDEIDGLAPVRSSRQDHIHASIVSTLLALMDGLDNRSGLFVYRLLFPLFLLSFEPCPCQRSSHRHWRHKSHRRHRPRSKAPRKVCRSWLLCMAWFLIFFFFFLRFDRELNFALPSTTARQQILKIHTRLWYTAPQFFSHLFLLFLNRFLLVIS